MQALQNCTQSAGDCSTWLVGRPAALWHVLQLKLVCESALVLLYTSTKNIIKIWAERLRARRHTQGTRKACGYPIET